MSNINEAYLAQIQSEFFTLHKLPSSIRLLPPVIKTPPNGNFMTMWEKKNGKWETQIWMDPRLLRGMPGDLAFWCFLHELAHVYYCDYKFAGEKKLWLFKTFIPVFGSLIYHFIARKIEYRADRKATEIAKDFIEIKNVINDLRGLDEGSNFVLFDLHPSWKNRANAIESYVNPKSA